MDFEPKDLTDLKRAKELLENPGMAARIANMLGTPIETGFGMLPARWSEKVMDITRSALTRAFDVALLTMKKKPQAEAFNLWHKVAVAATGGIGGFFGLAALAAELPISTTLMLRSIADVARSEGEDLDSPAAKMACIEVFALGGGGNGAAESGYFAVRAALSRSLGRAAEYLAQAGGVSQGASALTRFMLQIAERFSIQVSEKAAAQAIPAVGAAGGALINTFFIDHYQDTARGHFIIRRLERKYGRELVQSTYATL